MHRGSERLRNLRPVQCTETSGVLRIDGLCSAPRQRKRNSKSVQFPEVSGVLRIEGR